MPDRAPVSSVAPGVGFGLAAAFLFAFSEHALVQAIRPNPYLNNDFMYYPGVAVSFGLALALSVPCLAMAGTLTLLRPALRGTDVTIAAITAAMPYLLIMQGGKTLAGALSSWYASPVGGTLITASSAVVVGSLIVASASRSLRRRAVSMRAVASTGDPAWRRPAATACVLGLAYLAARALYALYVPLYAFLLALFLAPVFAGWLLHNWLAAGPSARSEKFVRAAFGFSLIAAGVLHTVHAWGQGSGPGPQLFLMLLALGAAALLLFLPSLARALLMLPVPLALLVTAAPLIDGAWRPGAGAELYPADHVLLISVDTLRRDALSAYNPGTRPTPHIDGLLADGIRFDRAWSPSSWTLPSVVSMLTGVSPAVHRTDDFGARVPSGLKTLAEALRERKFFTEAYVENLLLSSDRGVGRGFLRYAHLPELEPATTFGQRVLAALWPHRFNAQGGSRGIVESAWRRIRAHRREKLFLWLHFLEPHSPYAPPPVFWPADVRAGATFPDVTNGSIAGRVPIETLRTSMYSLYLAEVQYVDSCIGLLLDRMKELGVYDRTLIVFTSDHGEEFGEHKRWGHGNSPVESLVRIPLGLKLPGSRTADVSDAMIETSGLVATVLGATDASFDPPAHLSIAWSALAPPATSDALTTPTAVFTTSVPRPDEHEEGMIFGDPPYKYILDRVDGSEALYDLGLDGGERNPVTDPDSGLLASGRKIYHAHRHNAEVMRKHLGLESRDDLTYSDEVLTELRKLGYLH